MNSHDSVLLYDSACDQSSRCTGTWQQSMQSLDLLYRCFAFFCGPRHLPKKAWSLPMSRTCIEVCTHCGKIMDGGLCYSTLICAPWWQLYHWLCACRSCSRAGNATVALPAAPVKQPESPAAMLIFGLYRVGSKGHLPLWTYTHRRTEFQKLPHRCS